MNTIKIIIICIWAILALLLIIRAIVYVVQIIKERKAAKTIRTKIKKTMTLCDNIIIDGELYNYQYAPNNLHIENSCKVSKDYFESTLAWIGEKHPELLVWKRSLKSLKREWATHNMLYKLGLWKKRTKDVDLNYPLKWYMKIVYGIVGTISLIFIK